MKRFTAIVLSVVTTFLSCIGISFEDKEIHKKSGTVSVASDSADCRREELSCLPLVYSSGEPRERATADNSRMVVDADNPLFMFHACRTEEKSYAECLVETYNALPADIRAFSAVYADRVTDKTPMEMVDAFEEILQLTDANHVPIFLQIENYVSAERREPFTKEQLSQLFQKHESLMGLVHVELSCTPRGGAKGITEDEINRLKISLEACRENNALLVWQEMEYNDCPNTVNRALEDKALYDAMKSYAHNIIIQDKHNGQGRHFSTQSAVLGAWLDGVCDNWGSNVESWLWWEEGLSEYDSFGGAHREYADIYTLKYPPALAGIDTLCDLVGGATMYSSEGLNLYNFLNGEIVFSEGFNSVLYPIYQRILGGKIPSKEDVVQKIKAAYQFSSFKDSAMQGYESNLFYGAYAGFLKPRLRFSSVKCSKKWVPTTGRYFIIPTLPKYANAKDVLPEVTLLTNKNQMWRTGLTAFGRQCFLNLFYDKSYSGSATLFDIADTVFILNNNEYKTKKSSENAVYTLSDCGLKLGVSMPAHTFVLAEDSEDAIRISLSDLRLHTDDVCAGKQDKESFISAYLNGENMDDPSDFRTVTISLYGASHIPEVQAFGTNVAVASLDYSEEAKTATVTLTLNGSAELSVTL